MKISDLIQSYCTDPASGYGKCRYRTRQHYDCLCRRIGRDFGETEIGEIKTRDLILAHQAWMLRGIPMAHALIGMLRTLCSYGNVVLEDDACVRLSVRMHSMRFQMAKPRTVRITAPQVVMIRAKAHEMGLHSIAVCQSFQFEGMFRQKDCLGEWVPAAESGDSDIHWHGLKWLRGIRWEEIDSGLVLRHTTSKRLKDVEIDLNNAPMVMEEIRRWPVLPQSGPVVVSEETGRPYQGHEFRRLWRVIARSCGIPDEVCNMDSRAGAISEAASAGISLELIRHAATHSDVATTARYSRAGPENIKEVQRIRAESRQSG